MLAMKLFLALLCVVAIKPQCSPGFFPGQCTYEERDNEDRCCRLVPIDLTQFPTASLPTQLGPFSSVGDAFDVIDYITTDLPEYNGPYEVDYTTSMIQNEVQAQMWQNYPTFVRFKPADGETASENFTYQFKRANDAIGPLIDFANQACGRSLIRYLTASALPIAYGFDPTPLLSIIPSGISLPVPPYFNTYPSKETCDDLVRDCKPEVFPQAGLDAILPFGECDAVLDEVTLGTIPIPGFPIDIVIPEQPRFKNSTVTILGSSYLVDLPSITFDADPDYTISCQYPLQFRQEDWENGKNVRPCEDTCLGYLFYTENQWDSMKILMAVISWFCIVMDVNLMIVLLMSDKNRRYPGIMSVFMAIAGFFICLPFVVGSITDIEEFLCKGHWSDERADFDDGLCVWQACFILWGGLMGLLTWSSLAINTYVTLHLRWKIDNEKWGYATYAVVLGYPTIAVIIGTATEDFAYGAPNPYCWWTTTGLEWGVFYSIDILCCLVSIFCIIFVLYELRNIQDSSKGKKAKYLKLLRVFAFLVLFFEIAVYLIIIQSIVQSRRESLYVPTGVEYGQCLYQDQEKCHRPDDGTMTIKASQWYWLLANITGVGLPVVIVFGTTEPVFFFWCRAVKNIAAGENIAKGLTSTSSAENSSRGSWAGPQDGDEDSFDPDA